MQAAPNEPPPLVVVGAAVIDHGRLFTARRTAPPALAGLWEFPGGKVEPGEDERIALARECREELGWTVEVGPRLGPDIPLSGGAIFRAYQCWLSAVVAPRLVDHDEARWLGPDELFDVPWIPVDLPLVTLVGQLLAADPH